MTSFRASRSLSVAQRLMGLRPGSWLRVVDSGDEDAAAALAGMITLANIARDESDLERDAIDSLTAEAPGLISGWVETLNRWRLEHCATPAATVETPSPGKIGRNDPCSCGSGRKYKRCCGLN